MLRRAHVAVLLLVLVAGLGVASCSSGSGGQAPPKASGGAGGEGPGAAGASDAGAGQAVNANAGAANANAGAGNAAAGADQTNNSDAGAGGADAGASTDGYLSGSRLRAVLEVADQAKRFVTWHDSQLDIDCTFAVDAEGNERCLPQFASPSVAYADAKCTQGIVVFDLGAPATPYVQDPAYTSACGTGPAYLAVGAPVTTTAVYSKDAGNCTQNTSPPVGSVIARLGAPVAHSTFVLATKTVQEPRDARLSANVRFAADGSREVKSSFDLQRQAECNPRQHQGDGFACVPEDRAYVVVGSFFADDQCKTSAAYHPSGFAEQACNSVPNIIQKSAPNFTDSYAEPGAPLPGPVYQDNGSGCLPYQAPPGVYGSFYAVGKAVPWSAFAPFTAKNEGPGRIQQSTLRGGEGELMARQEFYDTKHSTPCFPGLAADSVSRCLPAATYSLNLFADAQCSQGVASVATGSPAPPAGALFTGHTLAGRAAVFALGASIAVPTKAWQLVSGCQEVSPGLDQDYFATDTLPPSEFVAVTREVE